MCECEKTAVIFIGCGNMFWGWLCKCHKGGWRTKNIKIISTDDIKPEIIEQARKVMGST